MAYSDQDRLIALAGLHQTAACVRAIAYHGSVDVAMMEPCVFSLFQIDAENVPAVYGPPGAVVAGAREVAAMITGQPERDFEMTRYLVILLRHERNLSAHPDLLASIRIGIEIAATKRHGRPWLDPEVLAQLATIYSQHISQLQPRILVRGNPLYLQQTENQHRIRALLLAGIRAAMLWRQLGGRRWQILFARRRLLASARDYLAAHQACASDVD